MTAAIGAMAGLGGSSSVGTITLNDRTVSRASLSGATVSATYAVTNDGTIRNHNGTVQETWNSNAGSVGYYEVRATLQAGTTPTGSALSTWLNCGTTRSWTLTASSGQSYSTNLLVEVRDTATSTVQDSATIDLVASSDSAGGPGGV